MRPKINPQSFPNRIFNPFVTYGYGRRDGRGALRPQTPPFIVNQSSPLLPSQSQSPRYPQASTPIA